MDDFGKIAVIAGIMGALLLFGIFMNAGNEPAVVEPEPAVVEQVEEPAADVVVASPQTLELLDPVYSEKAIFHDDTLRIAFSESFTEAGAQSRLPFWIHNTSDDVINILWDRCSMQLPNGNTVNIVNEAGPDYFNIIGRSISIAPAGDLFDAFIPVSEILWEEEGPSLTTGVLDSGLFTLVLAVERAAGFESGMKMGRGMHQKDEMGCEGEGRQDYDCMEKPCGAGDDQAKPCQQMMTKPACEGREIVYYTFRFVIR